MLALLWAKLKNVYTITKVGSKVWSWVCMLMTYCSLKPSLMWLTRLRTSSPIIWNEGFVSGWCILKIKLLREGNGNQSRGHGSSSPSVRVPGVMAEPRAMVAGMLGLTLLTSWGSLREGALQVAEPFDFTRGYARAYPMGIAPEWFAESIGGSVDPLSPSRGLKIPYVRLFITKHFCWAH